MTEKAIVISKAMAEALIQEIAAQHYIPFNTGSLCACGIFIEDCISLEFKNNLDKKFGFEGYYG